MIRDTLINHWWVAVSQKFNVKPEGDTAFTTGIGLRAIVGPPSMR
jgi:hypothetical protein